MSTLRIQNLSRELLTILAILFSFSALAQTHQATPPPQTVSWQNIIGVSISPNGLTDTAEIGWGLSGASSIQNIAADADGYVEFAASNTTSHLVAGLGQSSNGTYVGINFGIGQTPAGLVYILENGVIIRANPSGLSAGPYVLGHTTKNRNLKAHPRYSK